MVSIPHGSFTMGSPPGTTFSLNIERPAHQVTLQGFLLGKYEVSQGQYFEVTGTRPSNFYTNLYDTDPEGWRNLPVEMVSWYDALVFCNRLSIREGLHPVYRINGNVNPDTWGTPPLVETPAWDAAEMVHGANGYRLPTEAEWEYAAKGGEDSSGNYRYAGSNNAETVAWYYDNSEFKIHEIGKKPPNELGLHDMSGNVMEWCWDWLGDYTGDSKDNPVGPPSGMYRVIRGGAWSVAVHFSRIAYRHNNLPSYRGVNLGFRVARSQ
jgi:formylglycine-generating enzyme required for sulfatase activity